MKPSYQIDVSNVNESRQLFFKTFHLDQLMKQVGTGFQLIEKSRIGWLFFGME